MHLTLRRLHSQQLCVPLRIFRLLGCGDSGSPTGTVECCTELDVIVHRRRLVAAVFRAHVCGAMQKVNKILQANVELVFARAAVQRNAFSD